MFSLAHSVRLSDGWIIQKRLKLGLRNFYHTVARSLQFLPLILEQRRWHYMYRVAKKSTPQTFG